MLVKQNRKVGTVLGLAVVCGILLVWMTRCVLSFPVAGS